MRDLFLDNEESYLSTLTQLEQLLQLAMRRGTAIGYRAALSFHAARQQYHAP